MLTLVLAPVLGSSPYQLYYLRDATGKNCLEGNRAYQTLHNYHQAPKQTVCIIHFELADISVILGFIYIKKNVIKLSISNRIVSSLFIVSVI